jgi:hypothetical protein
MSNSLSPDTEVGDLAESDFIESLVSSTDAKFLNNVAIRGAQGWAVLRAATLIACYRMKQLYASYATRNDTIEALDHTSWTAWLNSIAGELPISVTLAKARALDIEDYVRQGADWDTIRKILANAPTAGHDVFKKVVSRQTTLPHVREEDLPGGSVQGLLEAIANLPPGQARKLVSEVAGEVQVYPLRLVLAEGVLYLNIRYEIPGMNQDIYLRLYGYDGEGNPMAIPSGVCNWFADTFRQELEVHGG